MKFALACFGTRGDVEPSIAVGRELLRRGHDVRMAVPPDLVGFAEAAGLATVAAGTLPICFGFGACRSANLRPIRSP